MTIKRKDILIDFFLGIAIVVFCYFNPDDAEFSAVHRLLDGCFVSGVLLLGAGSILFCANRGVFNIFGYGVRTGLSLILPIGNPAKSADGKRQSYYDYCTKKAEKDPKPVLHLIVSGGTFMLASVVLLVIYLNLK